MSLLHIQPKYDNKLSQKQFVALLLLKGNDKLVCLALKHTSQGSSVPFFFSNNPIWLEINVMTPFEGCPSL